MNLIEYHKSVADEIDAVRNRIRHLMNEPHWPTDGEMKESLLRHILRRHLPETFRVGRGFVLSQDRCSKQIDILVYDSSSPVIFKEGDLVFLSRDTVRAIIEVKSKTTRQTFQLALDNLNDSASLFSDISEQRLPNNRG